MAANLTPECTNPLSGSSLREEIIELRQEVLAYKFGCASPCPEQVVFPETLVIGLFGRTGCGKTSLINSLKFAAYGKLNRSKWLQTAHQEKGRGHIKYRRLVDITNNMFVVDNRGLDDPNTESAIYELSAQLDGDRGYSESVQWQGGNDEKKSSDLDLNGHPLDCAVLVFSAIQDIDDHYTQLAGTIDVIHNHQGRFPVAVITHVDMAEKSHIDNLKTVLHISGVSDIFEVANITFEKKSLGEIYQHNILTFLNRCMTDGDETVIFHHYMQKEQHQEKEIEQKQERELREHQDEWRAKEGPQMTEGEHLQREKKISREIEERRFGMEQQREQALELERERREQKRERRFQKAIEQTEELCRLMTTILKQIGPSQTQPQPFKGSSAVGINEVSEKEISKLAGDLGNNVKLRRLALELGFSFHEWRLYQASNIRCEEVCCEGTFKMLSDWKKNTPKESQRAFLTDALKTTDLKELAEDYILQIKH